MGIEYAKGGTLMDLMKSRLKKPLSEEECSKLMKQVLLGLKQIHRNDYVHRDIKPSNIVIQNLADFQGVKIVDFGLAVKYQTR